MKEILSNQYKNVTIYEGVSIGENVRIGVGTIIYPGVNIEPNCWIGPYCILGEPESSYYETKENYRFKKTVIECNSIIRSSSIIYENVKIGCNFTSGHRISIREGSVIGENCSIGTLCDLQGNLTIGNYVRLHSNVHIGQKSIIEDFVWIYPYVVLTNDPYPPMGKLRGVTVKKYAQIATHATILPGLIIGKNSLIGAAALVRKDVPEEMVIVGNPGRELCSVRDLKDDSGNPIYPWKSHLKENKGYPWQKLKA